MARGLLTIALERVMAKSKIRCQPVTSLREQIEHRYASVGRRAHERYAARNQEPGGTLDDWLSAEAELIWKPAVEVAESDSEFVIEAAIAGVKPKAVEVQVSPNDVLIQATGEHAHGAAKGTVHLCEFRPGQLFRVVHLPRQANPAKAHAEYRNGLLKVIVPLGKIEARPAKVPDPLSRRERP
jgi:HSP20 family protein